jgi:predicted TIM-barrel fold metal-dependent hydrolase
LKPSSRKAPIPRRRYFDAHVHPWPRGFYEAILRWFDAHAWPIVQRVAGDRVDAFLARRGVARYVAMVYAHKPGVARDLNRWMAGYGRAHPRAVTLAAVHPDDDVRAVLAEALGPLGLKGVKLHTHVMGIAPDDPRLDPVYEMLCEHDLPLVIHAGTEPASDAYPRPVGQVSGLARLERILERFPDLCCVVPHLGAGEFDRAADLVERFANLHLDSAMILAGYFDRAPDRDWIVRHHRRILYGSDFPILPYDYDRERRRILAMRLGREIEEAIFWTNASRVFGRVPP